MFKFKYGDNYLVLNFLEKRYDFMKFNLKIMDVGWLEFYVLFLDKMCIICKVQELWLNSDFQYVVVIYCRGGKGCIGVVILFYMYFINVLVSVDQVFDRFVMKKFYDDKVLVLMQFFQKWYVQFFSGFLFGLVKMNVFFLFLYFVIFYGIFNFDIGGVCWFFLKFY